MATKINVQYESNALGVRVTNPKMVRVPNPEMYHPHIEQVSSRYRGTNEIRRALGDDEADEFGFIDADMAARNRLRHHVRHVLRIKV